MNNLNTERDYHCCPILLDGRWQFLLWYSNTEDGVYSEGQEILCWPSEASLRRFAAGLGITVCDMVGVTFNLDDADAFIRGKFELADRDSLNIWNLLADVATSINANEFLTADSEQNDLYNHLFHLTSFQTVGVSKPGPLTTEEKNALRKLFAQGLALLRTHIRCIE